MTEEIKKLIDALDTKHRLTIEEYELLLNERDDEAAAYAAKKAVDWRNKYYANDVYMRGLIEFTNYCRNDCYYCGIRSSNKEVDRYRLSKEDILLSCKEGYALGFRTFVLQGGEDAWFTDERMVDIISSIRSSYPDCAITLSLGERSHESYQAMFDAGANRYLLRHESASEDLYSSLHPNFMSLETRMNCLKDLKSIGYQVGCGFMVGSPGQDNAMLAKDLVFIQDFQPDMCGIGPFIPHHDTPYKDMESGDLALTLYLLSLIRLIKPNLLLPATTALGTVDPRGREKGIEAGANVVMPNLSPISVRKKYALYDNKICTGEEAAECQACLTRRISSVGYDLVSARGDIKKPQLNA